MAHIVEDHLVHYGTLRKSGRYPWGSGGTEAQKAKRNRALLDDLAILKREGLTEAQIAKGLGFKSTTQLRALRTIALAERRQERINQAERLKEKGYSHVAIAQRMGLPGESSVRALLAPGAKDNSSVLQSTADMLKREVEAKKYLDVGHGVELGLPIGTDTAAMVGISRERLNAAVAMLREQGYKIHYVKQPQVIKGQFTNRIVLTKGDVPYSEVYANRGNIKLINETSEDHGRTFTGIQPPINISSKRIAVRYAEDGGADADGVIYIRRGAKDLDLGKSHYAQVRIAVDGTHYLKGMAIHRDDLPDGVDVVFNTNKSDTGNKKDAFKPFEKDVFGEIDKVNPFTADIKRQRGALNILNEEGDWDTWSKNLSSQVLSKQSPTLARTQLNMTYERRRKDLDEINALTNPIVRRKLLEEFADSTDAAAVHLAAAPIKNQATRIILPVTSLKPNEVYSPSHNDGDRVALVRFPHAGTFEIPQLTVNNRNREARSLLGSGSRDAIGIHPKVAQHLSGADFDGDFVLVIPNNNRKIKSTPALEGLKGFDPQHSYPHYEGMTVMTKSRKQPEMGTITNLIADMSLHGASADEMARAVRHSMVVIDAEKHKLDFKGSEKANGIAALKKKYQIKASGKTGGASTIITRATSEKRVPERRLRRASEGGPVDRATGKLVYVPTGASYVDRRGTVVPKTTITTQLGDTDNAHTLVSVARHPMEVLYADHSNRLKAMANEARKEAVSIKPPKINPVAKAAHPKEVASLTAQLNMARKNAPLERQAQSIAETIVSHKRQARPDLEPSQIKKIKRLALDEARIRTGAHKNRIKISDAEWLAIQEGAISASKLSSILDNADMGIVRKLATPRATLLMTPTKTARAKQMAATGATQAEIAAALGVSLTTLKNSINE